MLVDVDAFYTPLVAYFDRLFSDRLSREEYRRLYHLVGNVDASLEYLASYAPWTNPDKWE